MNDQGTLLTGCWYVAALGASLAKGAMRQVTLLGRKLVLARGDDGEVFGLRDFCPHRGVPLSYGRFDGREIECCYHGWCFNSQGVCTKIPALPPEDKTELSRIRAASFQVAERNGVIWVYIPAGGEAAPPLPELPVPEQGTFLPVESRLFACGIDHAVIGLMDPAHGPFVHRSWWWRSKRSIHAKEKKFAAVGQGFRMVRHKPSANSRAYMVLMRDEVETEITFQLPGLRFEHISVGEKRIVLLTALTPLDEGRTQLHQFIYSDIALVRWLLPVLRPFGRKFIRQDVEMVEKQQEGLAGDHPSLMLLGDADAQALWYFRLKKEFLEAQAQGRAFENKLREKTLRWCS